MDTSRKPSSGLIRTFSDELQKLNSSNPLGRGLAAKVALDRHCEKALIKEWDILLSDARELLETLVQDDDVVLLDQSRRLYAAWVKFRKSLPEHQRVEVDSLQRPDIKYLLDTVSKAASSWQENREQSKTGELKEKFFKLCENCKNHTNLLSDFKSRQNIAEGVVNGLDELSKDIEFWNRQMEEHGDITMLRKYIQELYVVVFEIFTDIFTSWSKSSWKRFLTSTLPTTAGATTVLAWCFHSKFLEEQLQSAQPVYETSSTLVIGCDSQSSQVIETEPLSLAEESEGNPSMMTLCDYDRSEIASVIHEFIDLFKVEMRELVIMSSYAPYLQADRQIHRQLICWLQDFSPRNLWIQGPHGVEKPSQVSMTAVSIVALSHENNIPTVSYFCSLPYDNNRQMTNHDALRAMLTSIIAQLVLYLPVQGSASINLSTARFSSIVQEAPSIDELLQLIRDLRKAGPRYMHCVIDSIQILEERSDQMFTRDLLLTIDTLCGFENDVHLQGEENDDNDVSGLSSSITKTCFTTDGMMDGLSQAAEIDLIEKIDFGVDARDGSNE